MLPTRISPVFKYLAVVVAVFFSSPVLAQSFYVAESTGVLSKITLKGSSYTRQVIESDCAGGISNIAVYKNELYWFDIAVKKATIVGNKLIDCKNLGIYNIGKNALTVDKNGMLYAAGGQSPGLYKIDPATHTLTKLGDMPYTSAGDLVFYKDQLYMASGAGIVKVNINNPAQSVLVMPQLGGAFGLASVPYSSTQNKVYVFQGSSIIEVDLDNNRVVGSPINTNLDVYDAASVVEDGSIAKIQINELREQADCPYNGKGTVEVILENILVDYTFELNGIINTTGVFSGLNPGTFRIKVRSNIEVKDTVITVPKFTIKKPKINISTFNDLCAAPGMVIMSTAADTSLYRIKYNNTIYGVNNSYSNLLAGTHRFIVLNKGGCEIDTIDVIMNKCEIKPDGADVQPECNLIFKGSIRVKTKPHTAVYSYKMGNTTNATGIFNGLGKGTYKVTITSPEDEKQMDVVVPDYAALAPVIAQKTVNAICEITGSVKFSMIGDPTGYTIKLDGTTYPFLHEFKLYGGTYNFTVFKPDGCILNSYPVTLITEGCQNLVFPNTFTPNSDGINDVFLPNQDAAATNLKWKIFTRYGGLIFTSENLHNGWNGEYNGKPAGTGVYYWVATYINKEGKPLTKSGNVALIR